MDTTVSLRAEVVGFHYLFALDESCPDVGIYLDLDSEDRRKLVDQLRVLEIEGSNVIENGNIRISARISGTLSRIDWMDYTKPCFVPSELVSPNHSVCVQVTSISEVETAPAAAATISK